MRARGKVELTYITNNAARKVSLRKRTNGLLKKARELTTLCAIEACAVIFSPYESQPEVWPSDVGARQVIANFRNLPERQQLLKTDNQETFLKETLRKADEKLRKHRRENRRRARTLRMYQCLNGTAELSSLSLADLNELGSLLDQNIREINYRIEFLKKGGDLGRENSTAGGQNHGLNPLDVPADDSY